MESIENILTSIKIPPAPEILISLNALLQKDDPELTEIAELVQKDASISGLVLKVINSPMFGMRSKVISISQAISLLGISYTLNIIMGVILKSSLDSTGNTPPRIWESASNIAMVSAKLAKEFLSNASDDAYLLGLFHNSGHALIAQKFDNYHQFREDFINHPELSITDAEDKHYNLDHATLGFYLARTWELPTHLKDIILNHHNVLDFFEKDSLNDDTHNSKELMAVLKVAEHIDKIHSGLTEDYEWQSIRHEVLGYLGLSELDFDELLTDMLEKLEFEA